MLLSLPPETIERVVAFVTAQDTVGGPPPGLYTLMQTCRYMHCLLAPKHNPGIFYRLFRGRFDLSAPQRRSPSLTSNPTQFAAEAQHRFVCLKLIRNRDFDNPEVLNALYVVYAMILEDDGKNGEHLRWAGLSKFLEGYFGRSSPYDDFVETRSLAIMVQSQWLTSETLDAESEDERDAMLSLLDPHLLGQLYVSGNLYLSIFQPVLVNTQNAQLDPNLNYGIDKSASYEPRSRSASQLLHVLSYFGHSLDIIVPALAPYAILAYVLRVERYRLANPRDVPSIRTERTGFGPTREDFDHYNAACQAHALPDPSPSHSTSSRYDMDWARLMCRSERLLSGTCVRPFRPGDLAGSWDGTLLLPSLDHVKTHTGDGQCGLGPVEYLSRQPIALELREHYRCVPPLSPIVHCEEALGIDSTRPVLCECALNLPGKSHEVDTCTQRDKMYHASSACTCDCVSKRVEPNESAVTEVLLTGVTPANFAVAWGSYRFQGRVRMSDGLVILRRDPVGFGAATPAWLFGYVLGSRRLVGRWHVGSLQNETPWEGVFGLWKSTT
ncbi:hypothetical protein PENSPDRAFT_757963 [Peniophora sp. CONT]|nr:hypothetical protein PENSPDRAFT_757963 [Peniophora sp. CONT]